MKLFVIANLSVLLLFINVIRTNAYVKKVNRELLHLLFLAGHKAELQLHDI